MLWCGREKGLECKTCLRRLASPGRASPFRPRRNFENGREHPQSGPRPRCAGGGTCGCDMCGCFAETKRGSRATRVDRSAGTDQLRWHPVRPWVSGGPFAGVLGGVVKMRVCATGGEAAAKKADEWGGGPCWGGAWSCGVQAHAMVDERVCTTGRRVEGDRQKRPMTGAALGRVGRRLELWRASTCHG